MWKNVVGPDNQIIHRWQCGSCALQAVYLRLQTHTQNIYYILFFHIKNENRKAPQFYINTCIACSLIITSEIILQATYCKFLLFLPTTASISCNTFETQVEFLLYCTIFCTFCTDGKVTGNNNCMKYPYSRLNDLLGLRIQT